MGWSVGFDQTWDRWIGYGVPATCDHPGCGKDIDRGLAYVCGGQPYGGDDGCGLFFCSAHLVGLVCERCSCHEPPFEPTPDTTEWVNHILTDDSWGEWRTDNPAKVAAMQSGGTQ